METIIQGPRPATEREVLEELYVGRRLGKYNDQARMWDRLGARSPESFPAPRHAAEVAS
jgi:hypothetical protein